MLDRFVIENYRCIKKLEVNLSFAEGKAPNGYKQSPYYSFCEISKKRIVPCLALYGANASGKTTILFALKQLCILVKEGLVSESLYKPNLFSKSLSSKPTLFELDFLINNKTFSYKISYDGKGINHESLCVNNKVLYEINDSELIYSKENDIGIENIFKKKSVLAGTNRQVKTFLKCVIEELPGLNVDLNSAFNYFSRIIFISKGVDADEGVKALSSTFDDEDLAIREKKALALITTYLRKLDFEIIRISYKKKAIDFSEYSDSVRELVEPIVNFIGELPPRWEFFSYHKTESGQEVALSLKDESQGTQHLFGLLGIILAALRSGRVILADEMDSSLHPLLIIELIRMFKLKELNQKNAQILFTLHSTDLLASSLLGVSEVGIVIKEGVKGTNVHRIVEFGARNVDNFRRHYLKGTYRGIPYPYI